MGVDNQTALPHARDVRRFLCARRDGLRHCLRLPAAAVREGAGQWIKARGLRERIVLITKGRPTRRAATRPISPSNSPRSLKRLQTDHVDIYLMHRDQPACAGRESSTFFTNTRGPGAMRIFGPATGRWARIQAANDWAKKNRKTGLSPSSATTSASARMVMRHGKDAPLGLRCHVARRAEETQMRCCPGRARRAGFFTDRAAPEKRRKQGTGPLLYSDDNFQRKARARNWPKNAASPIQIAPGLRPLPALSPPSPPVPPHARAHWKKRAPACQRWISS